MLLTKNNIDDFCFGIRCLVNNDKEENYLTTLSSLHNDNLNIENKIDGDNEKDNDAIITALFNNLDYDSSLSFGEVIKKLKDSFRPKDNKIYKIYSDALLDKFKKLETNEQLLYINDFLTLLFNTLPLNVRYLWSDLKPDVQLKAFDTLLCYYKKHSRYVMFWKLLRITNKEVLDEKYTKELYELNLNINDDNALIVPETFFVNNMSYVIKKAIEYGKFYELFEYSSTARVQKYFTEIIDIIEYNLEIVDNFLSIYFENRDFAALFEKITFQQQRAADKLLQKY